MKKVFCKILLVIFASCDLNAVEIKSAKFSGVPAEIIQNKYLKVSIIPGANGRIASLILLKNNQEMLKPYTEKREQVDPLLPEMVFSNNGGCKEWLWGTRWKNIPNSKMTVSGIKQSEKNVDLTLFSKGYMSSPIQLTKRFSLQTDALQVNMDIDLMNTSEKAEKLSLWLNLIPNSDTPKDYSILPVAGNSPYAGRKNTLSGSRDEIRYFYRHNSAESYIAPGASWNARFLKKPDAMLVISLGKKSDVRPDGIYYMWRGRLNGQEVITQEAILAPIILKAGIKKNYKIKLMVFPGMRDINALCGSTAIFAKRINNKITLTMNSTIAQPQRILKVLFKKQKREITVPAMKPGENIEVKLSIPDWKQNELTYFLGQKNFKVLPKQQTSNKCK
jgi:hypothetical protein